MTASTNEPELEDREATIQTAGRTSAPQWLLDGNVAICPCGCIGKRKKGGFVEKTLDGGAGLMRQVMFGQDIAESSGLLQRIDPRVKLVSLLVLLVASALLRHIPVLLTAYVVTLVVAAASAIPVGFFVKRVWLFIPIFTGIVVIPATTWTTAARAWCAWRRRRATSSSRCGPGTGSRSASPHRGCGRRA
jgi:hypothetical protein